MVAKRRLGKLERVVQGRHRVTRSGGESRWGSEAYRDTKARIAWELAVICGDMSCPARGLMMPKKIEAARQYRYQSHQSERWLRAEVLHGLLADGLASGVRAEKTFQIEIVGEEKS